MSSDTLKVFAFDYVTRAFAGVLELDATDRDAAGHWNLPGNCVRYPPPATGLGSRQAWAWSGDAWSATPDHRGETWWNAAGEPVTVAQLGDPAALGLVDQAPAKVWSAADYRAECARRIEAAASDATQKNMAAYFALLGIKSASLSQAEADQVRAFAMAINWINQMRQTWRAMAAANEPDPTNDEKWPVLPAEAVTLAASF